MSTPLLATKLYMPPPRPNVVRRPRLLERLSEGLPHQLTLLSAPAGFGKTTLLADWLSRCERPVAWLSLDTGENDPARFLTYLVAALQTLAPHVGKGTLAALSAPVPPSTEALLTTLLNDLASISAPLILVLDDYHVIEAQPVDQALAFLVEHLPPQMHLVLATRSDPRLPLGRLRARGYLLELRAADLRFTLTEAAEFLNGVMGLPLTPAEIAELERRTEGWIAGLQLAGLSLQRQPAASRLIASFTGSHRLVLDYLVEEVLQRQPERIQRFLLRTSILQRLCGPLCDAVLQDPAGSGQSTLEYLDQANLFLVPLDNERQWYRYHYLFADLLRQQFRQSLATSTGEDVTGGLAEFHRRASEWYEEHDLLLEAFQHSAAAQDVDRTTRLIEGVRLPLHFPGTVTSILDWLRSLPAMTLGSRPALLVRFASLLLMSGQTSGVEEKLQAAEAALQRATSQGTAADLDLIGQIAAARASMALTEYQGDTILAQSRRALEYLDPGNLTSRTTATWTLGVAHYLQGDRRAARHAYVQAIALGQTSGDIFTTLLATLGLGNVQEGDNQLYQAAETYQHVLQLAGDSPLPVAGEAHLPLARIFYEWNDLEAAERHGQKSLNLAKQFERGIDRFILSEVFLARLKLARGEVAGAEAGLAEASQAASQNNFVARLPEIAAAQVQTFLRQGNVAAAARLAETCDLPLSRARVYLAEGDSTAALAALAGWSAQVEARQWADARLQVRVLQALAYESQEERAQALQVLWEALALAEPGGHIRTFVDEGAPMERLLSAGAASGRMPDYFGKLLGAFATEERREDVVTGLSSVHPLIEALSHRELEVLGLIAHGCTDQEIAGRLVLAVSTVKGHNRSIFGKLQVRRRTEAVARAREAGLL